MEYLVGQDGLVYVERSGEGPLDPSTGAGRRKRRALGRCHDCTQRKLPELLLNFFLPASSLGVGPCEWVQHWPHEDYLVNPS